MVLELWPAKISNVEKNNPFSALKSHGSTTLNSSLAIFYIFCQHLNYFALQVTGWAWDFDRK